MMEIGKIIENLDKENYIIKMMQNLMEIGLMVKLKD